jgi:hypothetical protein
METNHQKNIKGVFKLCKRCQRKLVKNFASRTQFYLSAFSTKIMANFDSHFLL